MITIELDWPDRKLSPNHRGAWQTKLRAKQQGREDAFWEAQQAKADQQLDKGMLLTMTVIMQPPDRRKRDWDNIAASLKSAQDGICRALGIDDSQIRRVVLEWGEVTKGGRVVVQIGAMEN